VNVDGWEYPALGKTSVQMDFHVAGALELFVDEFVHAAAGLDQAGRENGEASALLGVARGTEELLRRIKRYRVHSARQCATT